MNEIETFYGMVENTSDALRILEMCRQGRLGRVRRRLHDRERKLIRSGSVFVFDEVESGIKRWTDGRLWSPSRILGNFLIYRELDKKIPAKLLSNAGSGDAMSPSADTNASFNQWWASGSQSIPPIIDFNAPVIPTDAIAMSTSSPAAAPAPKHRTINASKGRYIFAPNGLIKKTISALIDGHTHHLICYYSALDFCCKSASRFDAVLLAEMRATPIPMDLLVDQNFRKPEAALPFSPTPRTRRSSFSHASASGSLLHPMRPRRNSATASTIPALSVANMLQPTQAVQEEYLGAHQRQVPDAQNTSEFMPSEADEQDLQAMQFQMALMTTPSSSMTEIEFAATVHSSDLVAQLADASDYGQFLMASDLWGPPSQ